MLDQSRVADLRGRMKTDFHLGDDLIDRVPLETYRLVEDHDGLPDYWTARNNLLLVPAWFPAERLPAILTHVGQEPCWNCILICNHEADLTIMAWATPSFLFVSPDAQIAGTNLYLGGGTVYIGPKVRQIVGLTMSCRNDGRIILREDILIAGNVEILTDDCHTIYAVDTGERRNPFGGGIVVGRHVWIGRAATIMGDCEIPDNAIVGAGSFVRGTFADPNVVIVGTPARVVTRDVNWDQEDLPPAACRARFAPVGAEAAPAAAPAPDRARRSLVPQFLRRRD